MIATFSLAGCKKEVAVEEAPAEVAVEEAPAEEVVEEEELAEKEVAEEEERSEIVTRGPQGQVPVWSDKISLTAEEEAKVKEGDYKIAYDQDFPSNFEDTIARAIKYRAEQLGMEVVAHTLNEYSLDQQEQNIESIIGLDPDIITGLSLDPELSRVYFKKAADQGIVLVFTSNKPNLEWKEEYDGGIIMYDFYGLGGFLAKELNDALGGEGKIGYIYHDADFFITNQRDQGFKDALEDYPGLEIVDEGAWSGINEDMEPLVNAILTRHPEINGLYVSWAAGATAAMSVLRDKPEIKMVTHDIDAPTALELIKGNNIIAQTQCNAWEYGIKVVDLGMYAVLGKEIPAECILIPGYTATVENIDEVWETAFNEPLPDELQEELDKRS